MRTEYQINGNHTAYYVYANINFRNDSIKFFMDPETTTHIPRNTGDARLIDPNNLIVPQFSGPGQIVEYSRETVDPKREAKLVICNISESNWVIVMHYDTAPVK